MWSRKRLEIDWRDLGYAMGATLIPGSGRRAEQRIGDTLPTSDSRLVCLSVRTGFDLWLSALRLERGSEILVSEVTIPDMVTIIEAHGLAAVPIPVRKQTAFPDLDELDLLITPRTRAILVAHLFGGRIDLRCIVKFARRHGLMLIEDCAQAYRGPHWLGMPEADVSMFSFGSIKTQTALGGAVLRVANKTVAARMQALQQSYPAQSRWCFLRRVIKYSLLKRLEGRRTCGLLFRLCRWAGIDAAQLVTRSVRGFAGADILSAIRRRPSAGLVRLLARRLAGFNAEHLRARTKRGEYLLEQLQRLAFVPGTDGGESTHWVFPVLVRDPELLVRRLHAAGFDTALAHSLTVVRRAADTNQAGDHWLHHTVFLPCYPEMPEAEAARMCQVVRDAMNEAIAKLCGNDPVHAAVVSPIATEIEQLSFSG